MGKMGKRKYGISQTQKIKLLRYLNFKRTLILKGAAKRANDAFGLGVHVWAVDGTKKGWRPGDGPYYEEVTARHGKIE
jgi:hypothetical protein